MRSPDAATLHTNRGFPKAGPWLSFYGTAKQMGDLSRAAATFAILNIDADPAIGNFTTSELAKLRKEGTNRVLSYLNLGACEQFRSHWAQAAGGLLPCKANKAAQLGPYSGYPNEVWMNPANPAWRALVLQHVAPRLVAQGICMAHRRFVHRQAGDLIVLVIGKIMGHLGLAGLMFYASVVPFRNACRRELSVVGRPQPQSEQDGSKCLNFLRQVHLAQCPRFDCQEGGSRMKFGDAVDAVANQGEMTSR
ncbi:MAG: endo alpha-1,4 polygalactosaminidase [Deltaproteobacteria bacterium]|nr:endo alpha-1,4 polygalactosaminidase [Deltaproteobacteria bacterium]